MIRHRPEPPAEHAAQVKLWRQACWAHPLSARCRCPRALTALAPGRKAVGFGAAARGGARLLLAAGAIGTTAAGSCHADRLEIIKVPGMPGTERPWHPGHPTASAVPHLLQGSC